MRGRSVAGRVELEGVSFRYLPEVPLIEDLNLVVEPGQMVAIVGPTGAGKTTLVNLLMRFYEIDEGRITIDGIDSRAMSRDELRSTFGMVLQDTWLFHGTIRENIAYGREDVTEEEIVEAAKAAHVDHFVRTLPDGYDTILDDDATNVSQGEKQLLTIARAFLADRRILILDEATSSVDTRTEILIQRAMSKLMLGRTSFVIAHRLSTIRDARHDPRHGPRPDRRAGHARGAPRQARLLLRPVRLAVRGAAPRGGLGRIADPARPPCGTMRPSGVEAAMVDEPRVLEARHGVMTAIAGNMASLVAAVAEDVGETPETVRPVVALTLKLLLDQPGLTKGRAIMRIAGAQAARDGIPAERFLQRFTSTTWLVWEAAGPIPRPTGRCWRTWARRCCAGSTCSSARWPTGTTRWTVRPWPTTPRCAGPCSRTSCRTAPADPVAAARRRRTADRYGLDPDDLYRVIVVADRRGDTDASIEDGVHALGRRLRRPSRAGGPATSFPLPQVVVWRGLVVVLAKASWAAADKLPGHLDDLLGPGWVAVAGGPVPGVEGIAATMGRLTLSLRTAVRIGRHGWIATPDELALEELVTVDDDLLDAAVARELGAILADGRMGTELIETLEVYVESGQNMRETGRQLHLAPRTVAYRLERISRLLGHPLDGATFRRLSVAAFAYRVRSEGG